MPSNKTDASRKNKAALVKALSTPLGKGDQWSDIKAAVPGPMCFRGIDFRDVAHQVQERRPKGITVQGLKNVDLQDCDLSEARFDGQDLFGFDFRGATLVRTRFSRANLTRCYFGPATEVARREIKADGKITSKVARFDYTDARGAKLEECALSGTSLKDLRVDEESKFTKTGTVNAVIDRRFLTSLDSENGGLSDRRLAEAKFDDDFVNLKRQFGGFWRVVHVTAVFVFLAPYLVFLSGQAWRLSREGASENGGRIGGNLLRFISSGGASWTEWQLNFLAIGTFVFALTFNSLRGLLTYKVKSIEHEEDIRGHPVQFSPATPWPLLFAVHGRLVTLSLLALALHTAVFLWQRIDNAG